MREAQALTIFRQVIEDSFIANFSLSEAFLKWHKTFTLAETGRRVGIEEMGSFSPKVTTNVGHTLRPNVNEQWSPTAISP